MATTRIKDLTNTATTVASDEYLAVDGTTNGTSKITRDNFRTDTAAAFVAAPGTYNLAPLSGGAVPIDKGGTAATTAAGARTSLDVPSNSEAVLAANNLSDVTAATARTNLSVNSIDEDAEATATKLVGPALYFRGAGPNDFIQVADDDKLTFSTLTEFGTTTETTAWSPDDNTPALTDGTGTLNQHYRVDSGAGTVTQGGSTLSIINGTATTAGQAVYYDGSVWRLKDVDDLPFSVSAWVKMGDATNFIVASKYGTSDPTREWLFYTDGSDRLNIFVRDTSGNTSTRTSSATLTSYEGQFIHIVATYGGSGPNSSSPFTNAADELNLYINGQLISMAASGNNSSYAGMSNTTQAVWIGKQNVSYSKGHIKDVKIFNRELTAAEVAELARGNDLGFSEEWGGANGGVYTSDFSADANSWSATRGTVDGNIDDATSGTGEDDTLRFTVNSDNNNHNAFRNVFGGINQKNVRVRFRYYIKSGNSNIDGLRVDIGATTNALVIPSPTLDQWNTAVVEGNPSGSNYLFLYPLDGGSATFQDAGGDDTFFIKDVVITEIGTLADFRAENFDSDTGKIYDLSDNAFVGTSANLPTLTGRAYPVYETGTWTPTVTFGGGSTGITYTTQEGLYTRVGNTVWVSAYVLLSAKGSDTGTALINGLPFTASNTAASSQSFTVGNAANAANLTSAITAYATDNGTTINLVDWGATGSAVLDDTNFAATTALSISGTYQIQ